MTDNMVKLSYEDMVGRLIPPVVDEPDTALFRHIFDPVPAELEMDFFQRLVVSLNSHVAGDDWQFVLVIKRDPPSRTLEIEMYPRSSAAALGKRSDWSTIELYIACSDEEGLDPFEDDPSTKTPPQCDELHDPIFVSDSSSLSSAERFTAQTFLDQIIEHTDIVFQRQQRTHYYTLALFGRYARIARWDRSGCVYSDRFDFVAEPAKLALLLWRLSHAATPDVRGHDPSATRVLRGSAEYRAMVQSAEVAVDDHARELFAKSLVDTWPWWKLTVSSGDPKQASHEYLVAKPTFAAPDVVGRGTRGYIALDFTDPEHPLVYLKDCWRVVHPRAKTEGTNLAYLNSKGVQFVPTLLCHGDVGGTVVMARDIWKEQHTGTGKKCPLKDHRHYRIVVKEVGKPLETFKNGRELVWVLLNALIAHMDACNKANTMHRDISVGNILIVPAPGQNELNCYGLLTDWEMSVRTDESPEPPHPDRTGTWQFMSVNALGKPARQIGLPDELESFFNVLLHCSLRYLPHNCDDVEYFVYQYFDERVPMGQGAKEYTSSILKALVIRGGVLVNTANDPIVFLRAPPSAPAATVHSPSVACPLDASHPQAPPPARTPTPPSPSAPKAPLKPVISGDSRHPIDRILRQLLLLFNALYEHQSRPHTAFWERPESMLDTINQDEIWVPELNSTIGALFPKARARKPENPSQVAAKWKALEEIAETLNTHDEIGNILCEALNQDASYWPDEDKQDDQLYPQVEYMTERREEDAEKHEKRGMPHGDGTSEERSRKRARTGTGQ